MSRDVSLWLRGGLVSALVHGGLALGAILLPVRPPVAANNVIEVVERELPKPKLEKPKPPPPPKPKPPEVEPKEVLKPRPRNRARRKVVIRPQVNKPPVGQPDSKTPAAPDTGPKTFGLTMEGTTAAPGTGVAVPGGQTLQTDPAIRRVGKGVPKRRGFKKNYAKGELAPVAVITTRPQVRKRVQPRYPARMRELEVEGKVVLQLTVDEVGAVIEAKVLKSLRPELDAEALRAARQMLFAPAKVGGTPVKVKISYTFTFVLD